MLLLRWTVYTEIELAGDTSSELTSVNLPWIVGATEKRASLQVCARAHVMQGICARACDAGYQQQLNVSMRQINPVQRTDQKFISSRVALCVWTHNAYVWWRILRRYLRLCVMCVAFPSSGLVQAMSEMSLRGLSETPGLSLSTQPTLG